jgi:DNA-binding LytR/AlgR family response regulator
MSAGRRRDTDDDSSADLVVLAVDDERPALAELAHVLRHDPRVARVLTASHALEALRTLDSVAVDAVFLDIRMSGLSGLELARVLGRYADAPAIVFVTAYETAAVEAYELGAVDYVLKPVRGERVAEALRRVIALQCMSPGAEDETSIVVELGRTSQRINVSDVRWVQAQGDYSRLHTDGGSHLVRVPISVLEERWASRGFVRVHRSHLVALAHVKELRADQSGGYVVRVGDVGLRVSRRYVQPLKQRLLKRDVVRGPRSTG